MSNLLRKESYPINLSTVHLIYFNKFFIKIYLVSNNKPYLFTTSLLSVVALILPQKWINPTNASRV